MADRYPFCDIEPKWQARWRQARAFRAVDGDATRQKLYVLDMFPYPSGAGLHVGHPEGYTATDIYCRYQRLRGRNVLHPMGWDAFGLPAEQYALDTGTHPADTTRKNITTFRRQIERFGFSYDWDREVNTTDPAYVRWTQWIFLQLFARGLAYPAEAPVWWCAACGTVLANEEIVDGRCERKGHPVARKPMRQWMLKITAYAERLLADLDGLDWPESIKQQQRHWIGRSEGATVEFIIDTTAIQRPVSLLPGKPWKPSIPVFTTRPDTLFGATYLVLAPEHPLVQEITTADHAKTVEEYCRQVAVKSDLERTDLAKTKTGVFTGAYAVNPVNNERLPIWIADYVLATYGTGAIMAVPAHDARDFAFATQYDLPVRVVIVPEDRALPAPLTEAYTEPGRMHDAGEFTGLPSAEAGRTITAQLAARQQGRPTVTYRLRDWLFSRQRYWGEPIPIIHCDRCGAMPVPESDLPVRLPELADYKPTASGEPPLARAADWVRTTCPQCHGPGRRETNTMPQWAGSCWYYLRYLDPTNDQRPWDREKEQYWMPVDLYVGGAEHAVLHLLYARFWHKVLYDLKCVSTPEPFQRLVNQGLILGEDGEKMSKSRGNVVNPDTVLEAHGADAFRLYEMFMGPLEAVKPWNTRSIEGMDRFLNRIWRLGDTIARGSRLAARDTSASVIPEPLRRKQHETVKRVTEDLETLRFNTAIAAMMEFLNLLEEVITTPTACRLEPRAGRDAFETLVLLLAPFAPHLAEELWERLGHAEPLAHASWPAYDAAALVRDEVELAVQVNGKVRARITVPAAASEEEIRGCALADATLQHALGGLTVKKVIVVPNRLVNIVA